MNTFSANASTHRDIDYLDGTDYADDKDRLDVHMPQGATNAPVLVFFHGGALMLGDKSLVDVVAERMLPLGIGVVAPNYRLSPAVQHPAHAEDAAAALAWTIANIADYGGDPEQVFVAGHSAGAYLAALLTLDASYVARHGLTHDVIAGAILISPFLYVEETAKDRDKTVWGSNPDDWLAASVTPHISAGKAPMLLQYADGDEQWRKDQNERFVQQMQAVGNTSVQAHELPDRDHRTLISRITEASDQIGIQVREFINLLPLPSDLSQSNARLSTHLQ